MCAEKGFVALDPDNMDGAFAGGVLIRRKGS
jgi:hypothetical protein